MNLPGTWRRVWLQRLIPAAVLTCVVAVYNGFPLSYPDTGNYLDNASDVLSGGQPWFFFRPLTYGLMLIPFATAYTFWLVPLAQGLLVAYVVDLTLRAADVPLSSPKFVALFAVLSLFTSLPWSTGQVMPDVFSGIVILLAFVMVWGDERLRWWERWLAGGLLACAIATHLSHVPLAAILLTAAVLARRAVERTPRRFLPLVVRASAPLVGAGLLLLAPNVIVHRQFVLSRSSSLFALARLVGDGLAQPYLDRACRVRAYRLCSDRPRLRAGGDVDWFLWKEDGPRVRHEPELQRGDSTFLWEAGPIVEGTLREELPAVLRSSLRKAGVQLTRFGIAEGEHRYSPTAERALNRLGPSLGKAYLRSRQAREAMPVELATLIQYGVVIGGVVLLLVCLARSAGRRRRPVHALVATVAVGILLNALVLASLARMHPRYQARVIWLVPLVALIAAADLRSGAGDRRR